MLKTVQWNVVIKIIIIIIVVVVVACCFLLSPMMILVLRPYFSSLLQSSKGVITKCDSSFITKCDNFITKCDRTTSGENAPSLKFIILAKTCSSPR